MHHMTEFQVTSLSLDENRLYDIKSFWNADVKARSPQMFFLTDHLIMIELTKEGHFAVYRVSDATRMCTIDMS